MGGFPIVQWFNKREKCGYLYETYLYCILNRSMPEEFKLLLLVSVIEGLHSTIFGDIGEISEKYDEAIKKIYAVVDSDSIPNEVKETLKSRMSHIGSVSLQDRFDHILNLNIYDIGSKFDMHQEIFRLLKQIRNEMAHHLPRRKIGKLDKWQMSVLSNHASIIAGSLLVVDWFPEADGLRRGGLFQSIISRFGWTAASVAWRALGWPTLEEGTENEFPKFSAYPVD